MSEAHAQKSWIVRSERMEWAMLVLRKLAGQTKGTNLIVGGIEL